MSRYIPLLLFALLLIVPVNAQDDTDTPPVITRENIDALAPSAQTLFADLPDDLRGVVETGWFVLSGDGTRAAVVRRDGGLVIYERAGDAVTRLDTYALRGEDGLPATVLDAVFDPDAARVAALHTADGGRYPISVHTLGGDTLRFDFPPQTGVPVRIWFDSAQPDAYLWVESGPDYFNPDDDAHRVVKLGIPGTDAADDAPQVMPSAPENDAEAFVRIGRIPAPLAITSTPGGLVRLWHLETGAVTAEVQLDVPPVFGRINETSGQQLAWRDPASQALHLLDFSTGENRQIAELGGEYVQAFLVSPAADVVLAVHIGEDPVLSAWDTDDQTRRDFGPYWDACTRVPDMVQLSADGRAVVIGCDAGLIWWDAAGD